MLNLGHDGREPRVWVGCAVAAGGTHDGEEPSLHELNEAHCSGWFQLAMPISLEPYPFKDVHPHNSCPLREIKC